QRRGVRAETDLARSAAAASGSDYIERRDGRSTARLGEMAGPADAVARLERRGQGRRGRGSSDSGGFEKHLSGGQRPRRDGYDGRAALACAAISLDRLAAGRRGQVGEHHPLVASGANGYV